MCLCVKVITKIVILAFLIKNIVGIPCFPPRFMVNLRVIFVANKISILYFILDSGNGKTPFML